MECRFYRLRSTPSNWLKLQHLLHTWSNWQPQSVSYSVQRGFNRLQIASNHRSLSRSAPTTVTSYGAARTEMRLSISLYPLSNTNHPPGGNTLMRFNHLIIIVTLAIFSADMACAQDSRPKSPRGESATQIGEAWVTVDYGRPILRGRRAVFGSGESYGQKLKGGAPVWRVGANKSTRLNTEADLTFGDQTLAAGEYSMFIDLAEGNWTLIFSTHAAKETGRGSDEGLWGSYNYTDDKDVIRVPMAVNMADMSLDQFSIFFHDVTDAGGSMSVMWDNVMGTVSFTL